MCCRPSGKIISNLASPWPQFLQGPVLVWGPPQAVVLSSVPAWSPWAAGGFGPWGTFSTSSLTLEFDLLFLSLFFLPTLPFSAFCHLLHIFSLMQQHLGWGAQLSSAVGPLDRAALEHFSQNQPCNLSIANTFTATSAQLTKAIWDKYFLIFYFCSMLIFKIEDLWTITVLWWCAYELGIFFA